MGIPFLLDLRVRTADESSVWRAFRWSCWLRTGVAAVVLAGWLALPASAAMTAAPGQFFTRGPSGTKRIALSFDDGPGPETGKVLKLLERHKVKATFFMLGELAELRPAQVREVSARGHEVASHTWNHTNYKEHVRKLQTKLGTEAAAQNQARQDLLADMGRTATAIEKGSGTRPVLCRMPHGIDRPWIRDTAREAGVALVNWSYGADWNPGSAQALTSGYVKAIQPGAIFLMHDGGKDRSKTLQIAEALIQAARQQGYEIVTVGELLRSVAAATPEPVAPKQPPAGAKVSPLQHRSQPVGPVRAVGGN